MTYYAITGRVHGDDEDTCLTFEADTVEEARQMFLDEMGRTAGIPLTASGDWADVYITTVVSSATPINIL